MCRQFGGPHCPMVTKEESPSVPITLHPG